MSEDYYDNLAQKLIAQAEKDSLAAGDSIESFNEGLTEAAQVLLERASL